MVVVHKQVAETSEVAMVRNQVFAVQAARVGWHANAILTLKAKAEHGNSSNRSRLLVPDNYKAGNANQERTEPVDWMHFPYFRAQMFDVVPRSQLCVAPQVHQL